MMINGSLGCSSYEIMEVNILNGLREKRGRIQTLDFRQADLSLFSKLGGGTPWNAALKGKVAQECWQFFKDSILQAHEHTKILRISTS